MAQGRAFVYDVDALEAQPPVSEAKGATKALFARSGPASLIAAAFSLLACLLPWHSTNVTRGNFCLAPDCRSSAHSMTEVCTAASHVEAAVVIALSMVLVVLLQCVALWCKERRWTVVAGIVSLLAAHALALCVVYAHVSRHLFDEVSASVGDVMFVVAMGVLGAAAVVQMVGAGKKKSEAAQPAR